MTNPNDPNHTPYFLPSGEAIELQPTSKTIDLDQIPEVFPTLWGKILSYFSASFRDRTYREQIHTIQNEHHLVVTEYDSTLKKLNDQLTILKQQLSDSANLESRVTDLDAGLQTERQRNQEYIAQIQTLETNNKDLETSLASFEEGLPQPRPGLDDFAHFREVDELKLQNQVYSSQIAELEARIRTYEDLSSKPIEPETSTNKKDSSFSRYRTRVRRLVDGFYQAIKELNTQNATEIAQLRAALQFSQVQSSTYTTIVRDMQSHLDSASASILEYQGKINEINNTVIEKQNAIEQQASTIDRLVRETDNQESLYKLLKRTSAATLASLQRKSTATLFRYQKRVRRLVDELHQEVTDAKTRELTKARFRIQTLKEEYRELESILTTTQEVEAQEQSRLISENNTLQTNLADYEKRNGFYRAFTALGGLALTFLTGLATYSALEAERFFSPTVIVHPRDTSKSIADLKLELYTKEGGDLLADCYLQTQQTCEQPQLESNLNNLRSTYQVAENSDPRLEYVDQQFNSSVIVLLSDYRLLPDSTLEDYAVVGGDLITDCYIRSLPPLCDKAQLKSDLEEIDSNYGITGSNDLHAESLQQQFQDSVKVLFSKLY